MRVAFDADQEMVPAMTGPSRQYPGASGGARGVPGAKAHRSADILELMLADHRRIVRLCNTLYATARQSGEPRPDWVPGHIWQRLTDVLLAHTEAEERFCYVPLLGAEPLLGAGPRAIEPVQDSIAEHDDIRRIIGEASGQAAGSASWWGAVRTVIARSGEHFEHEERDVLPSCMPGLSMSRRKELGRQWCAFMAAWRPDGTPGSPRQSSGGPAA